MLIVHGDNFGVSEGANLAVARAFAEGLISSASLVPNGAAFEHACALAHRGGFAERLGVQFDLGDGAPLSAAMAASPLFCDVAGRFRPRRPWLPAPRSMALLGGELAAQIARCRARGLALSHAASSGQAHLAPAVGWAVLRALRAHGIPYLRIADNTHRTSWPRRLYKGQANLLLALAGVRGARYCCDLSRIARMAAHSGGADCVVELAVSPGWSADGELIDGVYRRALAAAVGAVVPARGLTSYHALRRAPG